MKKHFLVSVAFSFVLFSCNQEPSVQPAENATDAAREFVRAALDGDYPRASGYLLKDSVNLLLFERQKMNYVNMTSAQKESYKSSSIRPIGIEKVNDSVSVFRYYHSANPTDTFPLRVKKENGLWLVDLKSVIKM